jgi:ABC-2 type transport system ATP-binding protein
VLGAGLGAPKPGAKTTGEGGCRGAMKALATDALTKDYAVGFWRKRPYRALDRLSLEVEPGEVFGFLGPNGAGKTTTLKLLMQLVYPTSGRAEIFGRPVGEPAVKRRLGYLAENPYFYDYLTAEELLTYFAGLFGYGPAERRTRASRLLDDVGIGRERRLQLRKFSKGMLQRVGIAQALINDPELVIFDEPMSGLDPLGRRDVRSLILSLRDRGCTVFFSSHVLSDAEALCSRVAILAKGRLMKSGRLADMLDLQAQGWELVVGSVTDELARTLESRARRITKISEGRYAVELPVDLPPDRVVSEIAAAGATVVSLNPLRETLEDIFIEQVARSGDRA